MFFFFTFKSVISIEIIKTGLLAQSTITQIKFQKPFFPFGLACSFIPKKRLQSSLKLRTVECENDTGKVVQ